MRKGLALARKTDRHDQRSERWKTMARVALGQGKMGARPLAAFFHLIVYVGFVLINLEVLEILLDGLTGQHRILQAPLGGLYTAAINFFEILGVLVIVACVVFLLRRWFGGIARFTHSDLTGWPQQDAAIILYTEIVLMAALLVMNAAEAAMPDGHAPFVVAQALAPLFSGLSPEALHLWMEAAWWFHFLGILAFLNYLPKSKHFHIILAFPNTWYSKLSARGRIPAMTSVTREIKAMLDPSYVPDSTEVPARFGAKDIEDLHFVNVLNAYSCTECGRCTSQCPAN
ncbi:MAG: Fe-S oxidoreductase, partial [Schleiferiaceae bacterium]